MTRLHAAIYSVHIGESQSVGDMISYSSLLRRLMEFTVRAAIARSVDEPEWEHEELRRKGLAALQIVRNGKAVWPDRETFEKERADAAREHDPTFERSNEFDARLYGRLDRDLRARWRRAGYSVPSLLSNMKSLFIELERDAADRAAHAREDLLNEVLNDA